MDFAYSNIRRLERMPRGGHFAAWEQPELLASEIIQFYTVDVNARALCGLDAAMSEEQGKVSKAEQETQMAKQAALKAEQAEAKAELKQDEAEEQARKATKASKLKPCPIIFPLSKGFLGPRLSATRGRPFKFQTLPQLERPSCCTFLLTGVHLVEASHPYLVRPLMTTKNPVKETRTWKSFLYPAIRMLMPLPNITKK